MAFDNNVDYSTKIREAISRGASAGEVAALNNARNEKIAANSSLSQYANDDISKGASSYAEIMSGRNSRSSSGSSGGGSSIDDYMSRLQSQQNALNKQLLDAQRKSTIAALEKSRSQALSGLSQERSTVTPTFSEARRQANVVSDKAKRDFENYLAAKGLSSSGLAAQGYMNRTNELQGNLGALKQQENQALSDIARRESLVNENYANDLAAAEQNMQSQALQNQLAQMAANQSLAYQLQKDALANQRYDTEYADKLAQMQKQNYAATVGQYGNDYQAQMNIIANDGDPTNDWQLDILGAARQDKIAGQQAAAAKQAQQDFENNYKMQQLANQYYRRSSVGSRAASTQADIQADYAAIEQNPEDAVNEVFNNKKILTEKYGTNGYNALLEYARSLDPYSRYR